MTTLLQAALSERELLEMEIDDLRQITEDLELPEVSRAGASIRLNLNEYAMIMLDGMIQATLDRMTIDELMFNINQTTCKISR